MPEQSGSPDCPGHPAFARRLGQVFQAPSLDPVSLNILPAFAASSSSCEVLHSQITGASLQCDAMLSNRLKGRTQWNLDPMVRLSFAGPMV